MNATIQIAHGISERFAVVIWSDINNQYTSNICDVCDGKTRAPKAVVQFAKGWLGL